MAGLDLFEMFQSLYLLHHKSKSGIFVFFGILDPTGVNSWIVIVKKVISSDNCESLNTKCEDKQAKKPRKLANLVKIPTDALFDDYHLWIIHDSDRSRCMFFHAKTRISCSKCNKDLCLNENRNSFEI